jgi:hypothetical protein
MGGKKILSFKDFAIFEAIYADEYDNKGINKDALKKMKAAVFFLNGTHPFFSSLLGMLTIRENRKLRYRTMATDGLSIHYDPDFVLALPPEEIKWVIAHEIMHNVLKHFIRVPKGEKPSALFNVAADYALNQLISPPDPSSISSGKPVPNPKLSIGKMPEGSLYPGCGEHKNDERFLNMSTEEIYSILVKEGYKPKTPSTTTPPPPPPPPAPPQDPKVGDVIYDADNSTYGVVTSVDLQSGSIEYDPIPKEKVREFAKKSIQNFN